MQSVSVHTEAFQVIGKRQTNEQVNKKKGTSVTRAHESEQSDMVEGVREGDFWAEI